MKKSKPKPSKAAGPPGVVLLATKCRLSYKKKVDAFAKRQGVTTSRLIRDALGATMALCDRGPVRR